MLRSDQTPAGLPDSLEHNLLDVSLFFGFKAQILNRNLGARHAFLSPLVNPGLAG
jgi:hypothetical protein